MKTMTILMAGVYFLFLAAETIPRVTADTSRQKYGSQAKNDNPGKHDDIELKESQIFIQRVFEKYGDKGKITFEGFEHLLGNLGLGNININDHDVHDHYPNTGGFREFHSHHNHTAAYEDQEGHPHTQEPESGDHKSGRRHQRHASVDYGDDRTRSRLTLASLGKYNKCLGPNELLETFEINGEIDEIHFLHVCPAIIYQLDEKTCLGGGEERHFLARCHAEFHRSHKHDYLNNGESSGEKQSRSPPRNLSVSTWLYAMAAVTIISIVGFLCVGIIPILQKLKESKYRALLQFLVALAIGTLTGDALLHLIPHAMVPHNEEPMEPHDAHDASHSHKRPVFIGACALAGIYLFFIMERLVGLVGNCKNTTKTKKNHNHDDLETNQIPPRNSYIGEKLSSYALTPVKLAEDPAVVGSQHDSLTIEQCAPINLASDVIINESLSNTHRFQKEVQEEYHDDDGHSHGHHGHSHASPGDGVSAIVWMVIMGDGFHNFCDGLAIGAAFASSVTGGFSTSVAVFFHELPHEIGDFAVLLNAGMPTKQALIYNVISSVLCLFGLFIGLVIGNFSSATPWIFSVTAGMFIYISLADMLPELSSFAPSVKEKAARQHLVLQCGGVATGLAIMLTIALYEDALAQILE